MALKATVGSQHPECVTEGFRDLHQRAKIAKGGQRDLLPDDKTDVRTGCSLCAQLEKLAEHIHRETATSVLEQAAAQACVFQDRVRVGPKLTEHARNNRCDTYVEEAPFSRAGRGMRGGGGGLHGSDPILASQAQPGWVQARQITSLGCWGVVGQGLLYDIKRLLCVGSMRPVVLRLGLPFIQERLAFLRRTREVDGVMSQLLKPRDDLSNLRRVDDVYNLSIRPFGEDRDKHQLGLLSVHRTLGQTLSWLINQKRPASQRAVNFEPLGQYCMCHARRATKHRQQGIESDHFRVKRPMPRVGCFQAFHTARRTIQGFEAMLWLRKGFGFAGRWTVCEQNRLLALCFGLPEVNKV